MLESLRKQVVRRCVEEHAVSHVLLDDRRTHSEVRQPAMWQLVTPMRRFAAVAPVHSDKR
jgi:hypothetical protein